MSKLIRGDVIYTDEISDNDCTYTIFNIQKERFERLFTFRFLYTYILIKYISIEKNLNVNNYISDFKKLPTNLVYAFGEPDDQIDVFNNVINQCMSDHAPTKKVKFTRPQAPWMKEPEIINHLENLRNTSHDLNHTEPSARQSYQAARKTIKKPYDPKKLFSYEKRLVPKIREKYGKRLIVYLIHRGIE